jgi:hypothetical protein
VKASAFCLLVAASIWVSACGGEKTFTPEEVEQAFQAEGLELLAVGDRGEDEALFAPASPEHGISFRVIVFSDAAAAERQANSSRTASQTVPELSELAYVRHANVLVEYEKTRTGLEQKLRDALAAPA